VVFRSARLDRDQRNDSPDEIIPFLNDYAQAAIDAIHDAGGDVLKLIGDGVLAMFTGGDMTAPGGPPCGPSIVSGNMTSLNAARSAGDRPTTSAYVGLHVGEVFYGNIGSEDRLDFTVVGPAVNEVSRIASMCRSVDRELLASSDFQAGWTRPTALPRLHRRFALRGIGRAQIFTPRSNIASDQPMEAATQLSEELGEIGSAWGSPAPRDQRMRCSYSFASASRA